MKKTARRFFAVLVAAITLVCCMSVAASADAPADGTIYPIFLIADTQPQYKFYYTTAAKGTNPMTGRVDASVGAGQKVIYESDTTFNLIVDKLDGDEMGRAMIAFIAPADGEYKVEFNPGLWSEGAGTSYVMEVYADGKLVDSVVNVGGAWGNSTSVTVKVRAGKEICIVPGVADEGGKIGCVSQELKIVNYKMTYVKAATFEDETPDTNPGGNADTSDSAIAVVVAAVACGAALAVVCKKSHR